ncbi:MV entry-fusion complex protein [Brazilian porcupinepox virus 1]|nr:MV entry-fusion complex protein [Brazilian porcupinepox virus 1]
MGSSVSLESLTVTQNPKNDEKYINLKFNDSQYDKKVTFYEDKKIYDKETDVISPKFCLTNNLDISYCGSFLSDELSKKYVLTNSESCRSFTFRPGSIISYTGGINEDYLDNKIPDAAKKFIAKGIRCNFIKKDYVVDDISIFTCCTRPDKNCPNILNNGFKTPHCDVIMSSYCKTNPWDGQCLNWLREKRSIALYTYSDICSDNMDKSYCSEFIRVTRPDNFIFGDTALLNFCKKHKANRNCWCIFPPRESVEKKYLGPRVCWMHECTSDSRDRKWLLYDQDVQRTRCKYTGCSININSLVVKNSNVDLTSDCRGYNVPIGNIDPGTPKKNNKTKNTPNVFSFIFIFILVAFILYFLIIYQIKRVKTKDINVSR